MGVFKMELLPGAYYPHIISHLTNHYVTTKKLYIIEQKIWAPHFNSSWIKYVKHKNFYKIIIHFCRKLLNIYSLSQEKSYTRHKLWKFSLCFYCSLCKQTCMDYLYKKECTLSDSQSGDRKGAPAIPGVRW